MLPGESRWTTAIGQAEWSSGEMRKWENSRVGRYRFSTVICFQQITFYKQETANTNNRQTVTGKHETENDDWQTLTGKRKLPNANR